MWQKISSFLASLSYLKCDTFIDDKTKADLEKIKPDYTVTVQAKEEIIFTLYRIKDEKKMHGISSTNDYVFTLSDFNAKQITDSIDTLLGVKSENS